MKCERCGKLLLYAQLIRPEDMKHGKHFHCLMLDIQEMEDRGSQSD